jgi:hypothetical protein
LTFPREVGGAQALKFEYPARFQASGPGGFTVNKRTGFMRHNQNRRSRGRSRKGPNPLTRSYESNGPDVKVRGNAAHVAEKYMTLARDAQSSGDSVAAENYLQHAEHYIRIVMAAQAQFQPQQPNQLREGQDDFEDDDRQMNGRIRDRFDSNGRDGRAPEDDSFEGDDGEEDDRGFQPPQAAQQFRPNDRPNQPRQEGGGYRADERGPRNDDRGQYRTDDRGPRNDDRGQRNDRGPRGDDRGPRNDDRGPRNDDRAMRNDDRPRHDNPRQDNSRQDNRGPRPPRYDRRDRPDRNDAPRQDFSENNSQPERFEAAPPIERFEGSDERDARPEMNGAVDYPQAPESQVALPEDAAAQPRRRRGRPPRSLNGVEAPADTPDVTPDGAAALAAFPD